MKTFSSIYPFTNRLELRRATCITSGAEGGGSSGNDSPIVSCPIWGNECPMCGGIDKDKMVGEIRQGLSGPPLLQGVTRVFDRPIKCPRSGGDYVMRDWSGEQVNLLDDERAVLSGWIARRNIGDIKGGANPEVIGIGTLEEAHKLNPSEVERVNLTLQGLVWLSKKLGKKPMIEESSWAFLMACSYSLKREEVVHFLHALKKDGYARVHRGSEYLAEVTPEGYAYHDESLLSDE